MTFTIRYAHLVDADSKEEAKTNFDNGRFLSLFIHEKPQWPMVLRPLKLLAKSGDRGAGDIIARTIGPIGGEAFKQWYKAAFGKDCGCGRRQEVLNARWPL